MKITPPRHIVVISVVIFLLIILVAGVRHAEPVGDGDLWWQMAYGKYMIENKTLIPDHSVYTWTPADNSTIYCAWTAEIFLYLLYKHGGLSIIFLFRYLAIIFFVAMVYFYAYRNNIIFHPLTGLICLVGLLMSYVGTYLKPELFSFVLMVCTAVTWFTIKKGSTTSWMYCYILPVIMLVWVNTHGGFIFGGVFLAMTFIGEMLNTLFSQENALEKRIQRHFLTSVILSGLTIFITPYGINYPLQLLDLFDASLQNEVKTIFAYYSIFNDNYLHSIELVLMSSGILAFLFAINLKSKKIDWTVILPVIVLGAFFIKYQRCSYYFAVVFVFNSLHLLSHMQFLLLKDSTRRKRFVNSLVLALSIFYASRSVFEALYKPPMHGYFGFGIGYLAPVEESEFIKNNFKGFNVGNDYNQGGYLLWDLYPDSKIMIDPRYFPFRGWYARYHDYFFNSGNIKRFLDEFPCDVFCLQLFSRPATRAYFINSDHWKLVFFGPSSAVFVKSGITVPVIAHKTAPGVRNIKNLVQAMRVLEFSAQLRDWETARLVLDDMKINFTFPIFRAKVSDSENYLLGKIAFNEKKYETAIVYLEKCYGKTIYSGPDLINSHIYAARDRWDKGDIPSARDNIQRVLKLNPMDPYGLYNYGMILWWISHGEPSRKLYRNSNHLQITRLADARDGKKYLTRFIDQVKLHPEAKPVIEIAQSIVKGTYKGKPPFLYPPEQSIPVRK